MHVRQTTVVLPAAILFLACGGVSTVDGPAGTSGKPGSAGGGGSGAVAGNGSAGGGSSSPITEIEKMCAQIDTLPCKSDQCVTQTTESAAEALKSGCNKEFKALLDCTLADPWVCIPGKDDPQMHKFCYDLLDVYTECVSPSVCASTSSIGACRVNCSSPVAYGAECAWGNPGSLSCTCTAGPSTGKKFDMNGDCGDPKWIDGAEGQCTQ